MTPEPGAGDRDGLPRVIMLIALLLGLTTAGSFLGRNQDASATRDATTRASVAASASTPAEVDKTDVRNDEGVLRPLALFTQFIGPESLFSARSRDALRLNSHLAGSLEQASSAVTQPEPVGCDFGQSVLLDGTLPSARARAAIREVAAQVMRQSPHSRAAPEVLIATVPDWVDSSQQWTFDSMLDAIQVSAAQLGFTLVAYDLPDLPGSGDDASDKASRRVHESVPGAVLFRHVEAPKEDGKPLAVEFLLILLVPETTTLGVHPRTFANALDLALEWNEAVANPVATGVLARGIAGRHRRAGGVAILGPSFSGSAPSVNLGVKAARARHRLCPDSSQPWFQIVTPSATNPDNPKVLNIPGLSSFGSVTRSDTETLSALANYLGTLRHGWQCGLGVALLMESNTPWGRGLASTMTVQQEAAPPTELNEACEACLRQGETSLTACATQVPFPLHISRLRSESQENAPKSESPIARDGKTRLDLNELTFSTDRIAPATPALTDALAESMISGMFLALENPAITAVGVLATDKRDHVFLAQELARHRPNVLQFTIENSFVYLHPDAQSYLRGTVVASSYSLNTRTQFLTRQRLAAHSAQQFSSTAAHGTFNALASLMGRTEEMLDYDDPAGPGESIPREVGNTPCEGRASSKGNCSPPVWISVAAQGVMLPITATAAGECAFSSIKGYADCAPASNISDVPMMKAGGFLGRLPAVLLVGLVILGALAADQWRRRLRAREERALAEESPNEASIIVEGRRLPTSSEIERGASKVALWAASAAIGLWVLKLLLIWFADVWHVSTLGWPRMVFFFICVITLVAVGSAALQRFWLQSERTTLSYLACASAVGCLIACAAWLMMLNLGSIPGLPRDVLLSVALALAVLSICLDLDMGKLKDMVEQVAHWRRIPVLLGLIAFLSLAMHLALDHWQPAEAILYFDRNATPMTLASPGTAIVITAIALYWWGAWNLRRVRLLQLPEIEVGIGAFLERRALRAGLDPDRMLRGTSLVMGWSIVIPLAALGIIACGMRTISSVEGERFAWFLFLASACLFSIVAHTIAHSLTLARAVTRLLAALARHPSIEAIKTVSKEPFDWRLTYTEPHRAALEPFARHVERIEGLLPSWTSDDRQILEHLKTPIPRRLLPEQVSRIARALSFDKRTCGRVLGRADWEALDELVTTFCDTLRQLKWPTSSPLGALSPQARKTLDEMELVVFFHGALVMRDLLTRLVSGFTAALGGMLLLLVAHLLYTFQGRVFWLTLDFAGVAFIAGAAITVLQGLERNPVLRALWENVPGRSALFGKLTWRMAVYVAIFILSLVAAFFPELGGAFVKWLEPTRTLVSL